MAGRPNKYLLNVKPKFDEIKNWLNEGVTDKEIAKLLGINKATLIKYKNQYSEFNDLMKQGRQVKIAELKNTLFKKAMGFQYTEKEVIENEDGSTKIRTITKTALPSETALLILLKHWDRDNSGMPKWANDPATLELKYKEYEFKKEQFNKENW